MSRKDSLKKAITGTKAVFYGLPTWLSGEFKTAINWAEFQKEIGRFFEDAVINFRERFDESITSEASDALKSIVLPKLLEAEKIVKEELSELVAEIMKSQ